MTDFAKLVLDADTSGLKAGERDLKSFAGVSKDVSDRASANLKAIGAGLTMKVTLPLVAAAGASLKMASDFQTGMSNVSTLVDTTTESMDAMGQKVLDISRRTPVAISDLTDALYNVRSAGIDAADAMEVLEGSARLGVAGLGTTAEAVDLVTSSINAFGLEGKEQERVYDILFRTVKSGKTTLSELTQGFGATATSMANAGVELDDYMASIAAMTTTGLPASEAQSQLKAAIAGLTRETKHSKAVFSELGVKTFPELIKKTGGLVPAFAAIQKELGGNDARLIELVGSVEAYNAIIGLTGSNNEAYTETLEGMRSGLSEVDKAFDKQNETMGAQAQRTANAMQSMGISIGTILAPAAEKLAIALAGIAAVFMDLPEGVQTAAVVLGGLVAAIGPLMWALGSVMSIAPKVGLALVGIFSNPFLLGAAAVIGAIYLAWKNWDTVGPYFQPAIDQLTALAEGLGIVEGKAGRTQAELAKDSGWRSFGEQLRGLSNGLQKAADDFDAMNARNAASSRKFWRDLDQGWDNLVASTHEMAANVKKAISDMVTGIGSAINGRLNAIWNGAKEKIDNVTGWFEDMYIAVVGNSYVPDMVDEIGVHMRRLQQQMVDPAAMAAEKVSDKMRRMAAEVHSIISRLYPEIALAQQYADELDKIGGAAGKFGTMSENERRKRAEKYFGNPLGGPDSRSPVEVIPSREWEIQGKKAGEILADLGNKTKVHTVKIAESFKDMADKTISALRGMVDGIKSGDFFSILEGVLGMFTQLGSMGAFGKGLQGHLNSVPSFAGGGYTGSGGRSGGLDGKGGFMAMLHPRETVVDHTRGQQAGGMNVTITMDPSTGKMGAFVRNAAGQVVAQASPGIMQGGAQVAQNNMAYRQTRRVG